MNAFTENDDLLCTTAEHLGTDLLNLVVQEFKAMPDVWQKIPEYQQADVLDRAKRQIERAVNNAVMTIFSEGAIRVVADLDGVAIKDDIKFKVARANPHESLNALYESHGEPCVILVTSGEQFTGGMDQVQPDKDQPDLDLDSVIDGETDDDDEGNRLPAA